MSIYGRPPSSSATNKPQSVSTTSRIGSSWGRTAGAQPPVSQRLGSAVRQPTPLATRGTSRQQPLTRGLTSVGERLSTQSGILSIPKTSHQAKVSGRTVQDRSYWIGELKQRISCVNSEINTIHTDISSFDREHASLITYENRALSLTNELKELQGQLGDYNLLFDKLHTDNDLDQVQSAATTYSNQNEQSQKIVDALFMDRQEKEQVIKKLEENLASLKENATQQTISKLDPASQEQWHALESENAQLQADLVKKQVQLTNLKMEKEALETKISADQLKSRVWKLQSQKLSIQEKLAEMQPTKDSSYISTLDTKEKILQEIKSSTNQITQLESQISETEQALTKLVTETKALESSQVSSDKVSKYEELVKKDREMQEYLTAYPVTYQSACTKLSELEQAHKSLLLEIQSLSIPPTASPSDLAKLTTDLEDKDKELVTAESTMVHVHTERDRLISDLNQIDSVELKIGSQLESTKKRISELQLDIDKYKRADEIKLELTQVRDKCLIEIDSIQHQQVWTRASLSAQKEKLDIQRTQMKENETASSLADLVSTWQSLESDNFEIRSKIADLESKSNYDMSREQVLQLTNQCLEQNLKLVQLLT